MWSLEKQYEAVTYFREVLFSWGFPADDISDQDLIFSWGSIYSSGLIDIQCSGDPEHTSRGLFVYYNDPYLIKRYQAAVALFTEIGPLDTMVYYSEYLPIMQVLS